MADFPIFDTVTLLGVISVQRVPDPYWLNLCFPSEMAFDTEEIMFDMVDQGRKLAPFVAPNVQGKVLKERGSNTRTFRPAYVKPKHEVNPSKVIKRRPGERIGGELSLEQKWDALVAQNMQIEKDMITRRWDWMAARAVIDGSVTVVGDDYPSQTVDFGRDATLTETLTTTAKWDQPATGAPLADIEAMRLKVQRLAKAGITRLTFGLNAWAKFTSFDDVQALLSTQKRGSDSDFNSNLGEGLPYEDRGTLSGKGTGSLQLFTYSDQYEADDGTLTDYLDQNSVVFTGPGIQGVRCFGAIKDKRSGLKPLSMFPKMWDVEDPSQTFTMTQSAPLMVPAQPNGSAVIHTF